MMIIFRTDKDMFGNIIWQDKDCWIPKLSKIIVEDGKDSNSDRQDTRESNSKAR